VLRLAVSRSPEFAPRRGRLDLLGAAVSCACACHCAALPFVLALVPAAGLGALLDERVESGLLAATALIGTASLGPTAWRSAPGPGRWRAAALFAVGLVLLLASRILEERGSGAGADVGVLVGAGMVATAHLVNRRRARAVPCPDAEAACCPCPDERAAR
jgi:hypothetical protein